MLRINLLPSYVAQKRLTKRLTVICVVVFSTVVVCMLAFQFAYLYPKDMSETQMAADAVQAKQYIDTETALAASTTAAVAPIQAKIDFVHDVATYNSTYPTLYETVARFTSPKILYYGMTVSGSTLTINAYTPSIEDLGKYLQIMYHEPDLTSVSVSTIPTPDQAAQKIYYYKGVKIGESGGTATTAGSTTTTNLPGVPPGVTVPLPPGLKLPTSDTAGTPTSASPTEAAELAQANIPVGTPADVYATILSDPNFDPKYFKVVTRRTDGFTFTATCGLKTTFTPPTVPTAGASTPASPGGPGGPT